MSGNKYLQEVVEGFGICTVVLFLALLGLNMMYLSNNER